MDVFHQNHVIRHITQANRREFALFLGAGASISSGVPSGGAMVQEWRQMKFDDLASDAEKHELATADRSGVADLVNAWCRRRQFTWFDQEHEYSALFQEMYPERRSRQRYIESKVEGAFPSWGYLYLASIVSKGYFNVAFTTNFDDLVNDALAIYLRMNPVVCAADSEVMSISITSDRPKIIKLHGDYLFERLKNTVEELEQLDPNMERKFREFAKDCGVVVLGYGGRDRSIMRVVEELLGDDEMFPLGVYWGVRRERDGTFRPASRVEELATRFAKHFHLFECPDFDGFMVRLHSTLKLELPPTILRPFDTLRETFEGLVEHPTAGQSDEPTIKEHMEALSAELQHPLAKATDAADFDLLQSQLALGQRDYRTAIKYISRYVEKVPASSDALTTWGDALAVQGVEENSEPASEEAAGKWKQAIDRNPKALPPRYSLARHYTQTQRTAEAIQQCEELLRLAPHDSWLRRTLVGLYGAAGRYNDAQRTVDQLLEREPRSAELHAMSASVLAQRGLVMEALDALRQAVSLGPNIAWMRLSLANQLAQIGRLDEAAAEFNQAIRLDPNNLSYRMQLTNFYWFRQQPLLALPHLEAAVAIEPNSPEAHGWLGQVYLALGQLTPAQREMDIALRLSPQDVRLLVNTGILYLQLSQPDLAEGYLQQATQLNPTATQPHVLLCQLYWTSNRVGEFNTALQTLARIDASLARQVQMQLQAMQVQSMGQPYNQQAALQAQWRAWLQAQSQAAHGQPWSPTQAAARTPPPPSGTGAPGRDSGLPPRPW